MRDRRFLLSTFGSAGDLFPLIPVGQMLQSEGAEVRFAVQRTLGLYARAAGIASVGLGDGSEARVLSDTNLLGGSIAGWESWSQTVENYVLPTIDSDVDTLVHVSDVWRPDAILASGFVPAARIAAVRNDIPVLNVSIYSQHLEPDNALRSLSQSARGVLESFASSISQSVEWLLLGVPQRHLLCDPVLSSGTHDPRWVGFPYWDSLPAMGKDLDTVARWSECPPPRALVSFGSFIGLTKDSAWTSLAQALADAGVAAVMAGSPGSALAERGLEESNIFRTGFVPMSRSIPSCDFVIHHGGIGSTYAAIRGGRPALVLPQAFDQPYNAACVQQAGYGLRSTIETMEGGIQSILTHDRAPVLKAAASLIDSSAATSVVVRSLQAMSTGN